MTDIRFPLNALTNSPYVPVHTTGGALRTALLNLPAWRDAAQRLTDLPDLGTLLSKTTEPPHVTVSTAIIDSLHAGKPIPDLYVVAAAALNLARAAAVVNDGHKDAVQRLAEELDATVRRHPEDILRELNNQLSEVLTGVADLTDIAELTDLATAVDAGRGDDARTFTQAAAAHADIRRAQDIVHRLVLEKMPTRYKHPARILRNVERHHRDYQAARLEHRSGTRPDDFKRVRKPWPHLTQDTAGLPTDEAATQAFFGWAITSGADLWVPTVAELAEESTRADAAVAQPAPNATYVRRDQLDRGPMATKEYSGMRINLGDRRSA